MKMRHIVGLLLLGLSVLATQHHVARLLSSDGNIESNAIRAYITFFRIGLLLTAFVCLVPAGNARRRFGVALYVLVLLGLSEGVCALLFHMSRHGWHFWDQSSLPAMMVQHPYLVGLPKPGVDVVRRDVHIVHNADGYRGPILPASKAEGKRRVVTLGGSSTYCTGLGEGDTWPEQLAVGLGESWEVANLGTPGHSSVEHVVMAALRLRDLAPDVALIYCGWNDARSLGVKDLAQDYSDYHGKQLYDALSLPRVWTGPDFALMRLVVRAFQKAGWLMKTPPDTIKVQAERSDDNMDRALVLYRRNLGSLAAVCRSQNIEPVFIPQVLNYTMLTNYASYGWMPYVKDSELQDVMSRYNEAMREAAAANEVRFAGAILTQTWDEADFIDQGHFSVEGSKKFAGVMAAELKSLHAR